MWFRKSARSPSTPLWTAITKVSEQGSSPKRRTHPDCPPVQGSANSPYLKNLILCPNVLTGRKQRKSGSGAIAFAGRYASSKSSRVVSITAQSHQPFSTATNATPHPSPLIRAFGCCMESKALRPDTQIRNHFPSFDTNRKRPTRCPPPHSNSNPTTP